MRAVAHDPKFAAKVGVPQKVGEDFNTADEAAANRGAGKLTKAVNRMRKPMLRIGRQSYG